MASSGFDTPEDDDEFSNKYPHLSTFSQDDQDSPPLSDQVRPQNLAENSGAERHVSEQDLQAESNDEKCKADNNDSLPDSYDYYFKTRKQPSLSMERPLTVKRRTFSKPPEILARLPSLAELNEGDLLELVVVSHGIPKPTAKWFKDNCEINPEQNRFHIIGENDNYCLFLENVTPADSGVYKIVLDNAHGTASSSSCIQIAPAVVTGILFIHYVLLHLSLINKLNYSGKKR